MRSDRVFRLSLLLVLVTGLLMPMQGQAQDEKDKPDKPNATSKEKPDEENPDPAKPPAKPDDPKPNAAKTEQSTEAPLPKRDEMLRNLPTKADLLTKAPADWIVLKTDEVLVVKPIKPRPRTIESLDERRKELLKAPALKKNQGESQEDFQARQRETAEENRRRLANLETIEVELPDSTKVTEDQDDSSYKLNIVKHVKEIFHHEDLVLMRIDKLLDEKQLEDAYELLLTLDRVTGAWPGADERFNRFLLVDAQIHLSKGEEEQAYSLLEQMHARLKEAINGKDTSKRYASMGQDLIKCQAELGRATDALIEPAVKARDFRQARFHLARLMRLEPEHPDGLKWKDRLISETNKLLAAAAQSAAANKHDVAAQQADQASLIWPAAPNLKVQHQNFSRRWQSLKSGVVIEPSSDFPFETEASRRRDKLMRLPLFEPARIDGGARYRTRFLEGWEPTDLGRQAIFTLRTNRSTWESHPVVTASGAVTALLERLRPDSPHFDERLASFVDGVEVRSPYEFAVKFSRIPVRTEALFAMPLGFDAASSAELDQRYKVHSTTDRSTTYRRMTNESDRALQRHLAELTEITYPTHEQATQGLLRGEVSILPHFPVWLLDNLKKDGRFFIRKYALPQTHVLQFNPHSKVLKSSELRRSLMYSIDRSQVLRDIVLRDLTIRTLSEPLPKANSTDKIPPEKGLTYDDKKQELVWSGLSMTDLELRAFMGLSPDSEWRKVVLTLFRRSQPDHGRVVSAPWGTNLSAYNSVVLPREADFSLAFALSLAAKKSAGGELPKLRLICEPEQVCLMAAQRLVEEWKRVNINVELVTQSAAQVAADRPNAASGQDRLVAQGDANPQNDAVPAVNADQGEPVTWDIAYRTLRMTEPMMEIWPLLSLDKVARLHSIRYLPDWLRQGLINLDRTADWATAVSSLQEMHRQIAETVQLIPLWEIDDVMVFRKTVRGIPDAPLHPYHDIELWITEPWFPTD